ncbi:MAG: AAA family ATPase, partial [Actinomycetota bacterium]|nr:AAA family ATPase [Actinomycetota bacterium]
VVVVDEAGMAGTRDLAYIVAAVTDAGGKVVLAGDHHQLPEIAAGGAFRAVCDLLGTDACELTINRRQRHPWEHTALDQLRAGDVHTAWRAYLEHGRVTIHPDADALHQQVIDDWWTHHHASEDVLLLAGTRAEARHLNQRARARAAQRGELSGPCAWVGDEPFQAGDRIIVLHNSVQREPDGRPAYVKNGMFGIVSLVTAVEGTITVRLDHDEREVVLDAEYLDAGHLGHGYAATVYKAQGATCDVVLVVGPDGLNREGSYVALSRARNHAQLYATVAQAREVEERHVHGIQLPDELEVDPEATMLARLERSGAKTLASVADPDARVIAALVDEHTAAALLTLARDPDASDRSTVVYARAAHLALVRAGHALLAEPPSWLTGWPGPRPTDQIGALTWDDIVTDIAQWRTQHDIPDGVPGLGPPPDTARLAASWRRETLRLVEARGWFNERAPAATPAAARPVRELAARKAELDALVTAAPPDQRRIIADLCSRTLATTELHAELAAVAGTQTERRNWILEHWPHIVELEQINRLLASRDLLAHWPTSEPRRVRELLADLPRHAPTLSRREERSLADISQAANDADPIRQLEQRISELRIHRRALPAGPGSTPDVNTLAEAAATAIDTELAQLRARLARSRHGRRARQILDDYATAPHSPAARARRERERTVTHDALVDQPPWVNGLVTQLNSGADLNDHEFDAAEIAELISAIAIYRDRYQIDIDTPLGNPSVDPSALAERDALDARMSAFAHRVPTVDV